MDELVTVRVNEDAKRQAKNAVLTAVTEAFQLDMVPKAKELSPVTPEGLEYNRLKRPHAKLTDVGGTGTNRRSIDSEVREVSEGVKGSMFTTSGYGGWLEVGTSKMRAQPYIWPAFRMYVGGIAKRVKDILGKR